MKKPRTVSSRFDLFVFTAACAALALWPCPALGGPAKEPLNFIVIMADDCSAGELGCYGHKKHRTPHLDRLAKTGVQFRTCWATPVCAPSRAEIMTGRYGFRTHWYRNRMKTANSLAKDNKIFAQILKEAGYATAVSGKWQLFGAPNEYGFEESCIWAYEEDLPEGVKHTGAYERPGMPSRYWHPSILKNGSYLPTEPTNYGPDIFTDFIIDFVKRRKDGKFLVYYPMCLTHPPYYPTPDSLKPGAESMRNDKGRNFSANIHYMDKLVGRIVRALDQLGLRKKTVLFFTSDNGTDGATKNRPLEIACRVPMIVNCPKAVRAIGPCDELIDFSDILPTLTALAGARMPDDYVIDGRSFAPLLLGQRYEPRRWIFSYLGIKRMLRDKRWLLEGDGRFYDCADHRDGIGYVDVTESRVPEVLDARARFERILSSLPAPAPDDPAMNMRSTKKAKPTKAEKSK